MKANDIKFERRKARARYALKTKSAGRPRLSVYRSEKNIYAQIIDDNAGKTLVSASSKLKETLKKGPRLPVRLLLVN